MSTDWLIEERLHTALLQSAAELGMASAMNENGRTDKAILGLLDALYSVRGKLDPGVADLFDWVNYKDPRDT